MTLHPVVATAVSAKFLLPLVLLGSRLPAADAFSDLIDMID